MLLPRTTLFGLEVRRHDHATTHNTQLHYCLSQTPKFSELGTQPTFVHLILGPLASLEFPECSKIYRVAVDLSNRSVAGFNITEN